MHDTTSDHSVWGDRAAPRARRERGGRLGQLWAEALLFLPARGGCHLNDRVFNENVFRKAAKDVGRADLSAHDLRRFAGSKNAQVATLTENMARLGHKTVGAALRYQHSESGRDAIIAKALSAKAVAELEGQPETDADG